MKHLIENKIGAVRGLLSRLRRRDFSGNTGQAVKNSSYQLTTVILMKLGTLLFTVVLARLFLPELFGLYSLALSTVLIFSSFSEMGVYQTLIKFLAVKQKNSKAKGYIKYLFNLRMIFTIVSVSLLIILSRTIADYYNKPLFLALIAGAAYLAFSGLFSFFDGIFQSFNNFKTPLIREAIFQVLRFIFVPLAIVLSILRGPEFILFVTFLVLAACHVVTLGISYFLSRNKEPFSEKKTAELTEKERSKANGFLMTVAAMSLSGIFFGYIDMVMLGIFVPATFIGYYRAAFSIVYSIAPLIAFSIALFPIFNRLKGKRLEKGFNKARGIIASLGVLSAILVFILAPLIILAVFGAEYGPASLILRAEAILLIIFPIISLYEVYLISKNRQKKVVFSSIISTIINIVLNYVLIVWLLNYSPLHAVVGAAIATILSRSFYLIVLATNRRK
jgi:O-antigen/teichoic acid export membrane protein